MTDKEKERHNKIQAKLAGEGINSRWTREATSYMEANGYGINQISTKVAPYIRRKIKTESEQEAKREHERKIKLEPVRAKYIELRNQVFFEIFLKINQSELNIKNCAEISKKLLAGKLIKLNRWNVKRLFITFIIVGIIYGVLYWMFGSIRNASETTKKIILGVITGIIALPTAISSVLKPIELQTEEIFRGTGFSINDMDSSIIECDNNILKLIEYSLDGNPSQFEKLLKKVIVPLATSTATPPPLPATDPND